MAGIWRFGGHLACTSLPINLILLNLLFSFDQHSLLHQTWLKDKACRTMFNFIAKKRAGSLFLYKDELGWPISSLISTSPKQYILLELLRDLSLPLDTEDDSSIIPEKTAFKRAKGLHRGLIAEELSMNDFINVGVLGHDSRRVDQFTFKKHMFDIFLNKANRILLSRGNSKRLFLANSKTKESFFSLPLFTKHLPE